MMEPRRRLIIWCYRRLLCRNLPTHYADSAGTVNGIPIQYQVALYPPCPRNVKYLKFRSNPDACAKQSTCDRAKFLSRPSRPSQIKSAL